MNPTVHEEGTAELRADITKRTGLSFAGSRGPHLTRIVERLFEPQSDATPGSPSHRPDDDAEFDRLCDALTVQESFFFREAARLALIREHVLPWARQRRPQVRAWSAGCARGEEAYTLSMMLTDAGLGSRYQVLGTDLSASAVASARRATYNRWAVRGLDDETVASYFDSGPGGLRVADGFRTRVAFEQHNLLDPLPAGWGEFDVILCRNVLIYFTPEAVRRAAETLTAALTPGGWLLLGVSDPPLGDVDGLERITTTRGSAYRRHDPSSGLARDGIDTADVRDAWTRAAAVPTARRVPAAAPVPTVGGPAADRPDLTELAERALALADPAAAIDLARQALEFSPGEPQVHRLMIQALAEDGRTRDSLAAASRAVAMFPEDPSIREVQAVVLLETGQVALAMVAAREAVYLAPGSALAQAVLARSHELLGDLDAAQRARRNGRMSNSAPGEP